jgi:uncharacterized membrane protein
MNTTENKQKIESRGSPAKQIAFGAVMAALYVALTLINPLAFGEIQFRFSEILVLLCFYNPIFCVPMILGCFIANFIASPWGWIDMLLGTLGTALAVYMMALTKNIWVASLFPVITNAFFVGIMLTYFVGVPLPLWQNMAFVGLGQLAVITVIGVPLFKLVLEKNKKFTELMRG